jgi:predicted enzyme related to lactoylglutathione lyase
MARVTHFEIHAVNPERAVDFYTNVFDWKISKWNGPMDYWLIDTGEGDGINGGLLPRRGEGPHEGTAINSFVCTVNVHSLNDAIVAIEKAGGQIVVEKVEVPGVGWLCYAKDLDGNIFGILERSERLSLKPTKLSTTAAARHYTARLGESPPRIAATKACLGHHPFVAFGEATRFDGLLASRQASSSARRRDLASADIGVFCTPLTTMIGTPL